MAKDNLNKRLADLEKSRELIYGAFSNNMKKISRVWSVILDKELTTGIPLNTGIPAHKVALMYAAAKIVRASNNYREDSYDDALAYLVEANELHKPLFERQETTQMDNANIKDFPITDKNIIKINEEYLRDLNKWKKKLNELQTKKSK